MHIVLHDSYETVSRDGSIDLNLDCIFRCTPEFFDSKVLLESFEEQFNLPSVFVQIGNLKGRNVLGICKKCELTLVIFIPITHHPESFRISLMGIETTEFYLTV